MEMIVRTISSPPAPQGLSGQSWAQRLLAVSKRLWLAYMIWRIKQAAAIAQPWSASDCSFRGH